MKQWKQIPNFSNYEVSNDGEIRHIISKKIRSKKYRTGKPYLTAQLKNDLGKLQDCLVHRLVAITFLGYKEGMEIDHINRDPEDNRLENLRWVNHKENIKNRSIRMGTKEKVVLAISMTNNGMSEKDILQMLNL